MRFCAPVLLLFLIFAGCDQGPQTDSLPEAPNQRLAYALASALGNPVVRESVHQAMDASPYVEHKLVLQEFLESPAGAELQGALSNVLGGEPMLTDLLGGFPDLDFYLPFDQHRETWEHADGNLWAVCEIDPDAKEVRAYHPDGSSRVLNSREQVRQAAISAVFSLHRAEAKFLRNAAATAGTPGMGADKDDWKTGISKIENYQSDGGVTSGDCEFYFQTDGEIYTSDEVSVQGPAIIYDGGTVVKPGKKTISPSLKVNPDRASDSNHIYVKMMEDDGFFNGGDDYFGTFEVTGEGTYETENTRTFGGGSSEFTYPWAIVTIEID